MKIILTQELQGRGGEGDVIEVARGFAVNYLFPRGMAIQATSGNLKQLELRMHNIKNREEQRMAQAGGFSSQLDGKAVTVAVKVGEEGRLFGSVTSTMVAEAIVSQLGVEVDRRKIDIHGVIKELGAHTAEVAVYREVKALVTVNVVAEGAEVAAPAVEAEAPAEAEAEVAVEDDSDVEVVEAETEE